MAGSSLVRSANVAAVMSAYREASTGYVSCWSWAVAARRGRGIAGLGQQFPFPSVAIILGVEEDLAVDAGIMRHEPCVGDRGAGDVPRQIFQHGVGTLPRIGGRLRVDDPLPQLVASNLPW